MMRSRPYVSVLAALGVSASLLAGAACSEESDAAADQDATASASSSSSSGESTDATSGSSSSSSGSGAGGSSGTAGFDASADPGDAPSGSCPHTPDADGFFTLSDGDISYVARLPPSYNAAAPLPLLVSLKGCYDNAQNFATWAGVPYVLRATQSYINISVGGRDGECWKRATDAARVSAAIAHVRSCFYVDQKKIVLAGYDSGGELAYAMAMQDASAYAGVLIEHASLSAAVGSSKVDAALAAAAWKLNVSVRAGVADEDTPIATMRSDRDKMLAAGFPVEMVETAAGHGGDSVDWAALIPTMSGWVAPL